MVTKLTTKKHKSILLCMWFCDDILIVKTLFASLNISPQVVSYSSLTLVVSLQKENLFFFFFIWKLFNLLDGIGGYCWLVIEHICKPSMTNPKKFQKYAKIENVEPREFHFDQPCARTISNQACLGAICLSVWYQLIVYGWYIGVRLCFVCNFSLPYIITRLLI